MRSLQETLVVIFAVWMLICFGFAWGWYYAARNKYQEMERCYYKGHADGWDKHCHLWGDHANERHEDDVDFSG